MAIECYGWSKRDRMFWFRSASGLKSYYRSAESFRYALRNEHNMPARDADRIVAECEGLR